MEQQLKYIGIIHSQLKRLEDCPLQESESKFEATVEIFQEFLDGISLIKPGSDIILFTWLHQADRTVLKTKPRNNPKAALTSVFSTRSPDRPNPVGIHFVKIISVVDENKFNVEGLDVLDQTPLIDVKPDLRT